jgi:hypothetical protein
MRGSDGNLSLNRSFQAEEIVCRSPAAQHTRGDEGGFLRLQSMGKALFNLGPYPALRIGRREGCDEVLHLSKRFRKEPVR